jgi:Anti-sigma factor NepR
MCVHKICADTFGTNADTADSKHCKSRGCRIALGTPATAIVATDEKKTKNVRRAIRTGIDDTLRSFYGNLLKEAIPSRVTDLLQRLEEHESASAE